MTALLEQLAQVADAGSIDEMLARLSGAELRTIEEAIAGKGVLSFREFVSRVKPSYQWYPHAEKIASVLQRVADGELTRVIVLAPPRVGKSEPVSRLLPAYQLYRRADRFVGLTSYTAGLAYSLSRSARQNYQAFGRPIAGDAGAVQEWHTGQGGGMWAAGFGGSLLGKGAHTIIIDDPIKNAEEANSDTIAERNRDFYGTTLRTRLEPGGAIVVILQRWPGVADLVKYLFELETGDHPERWHVVVLDAEKSDDEFEMPDTCTREPDWRATGELLCEARLPREALDRIRQAQGEYYYAAQFQQRPRPRDGRMFPRELATIVDAVPAGVRWLRYWDKAGTEGGGAYTAGVRMCIHEGLVYIDDAQRCQHEALRRRKLMRQTAELDGTGVEQVVEQEPGSGGKDSAADDVRLLVGFTARAERATGDKVVRAEPFAAQWQAGNVRLRRGPWNKAYLDELERFPNGSFKDQTDASSGAFNQLAIPFAPRIRSLDD